MTTFPSFEKLPVYNRLAAQVQLYCWLHSQHSLENQIGLNLVRVPDVLLVIGRGKPPDPWYSLFDVVVVKTGSEPVLLAKITSMFAQWSLLDVPLFELFQFVTMAHASCPQALSLVSEDIVGKLFLSWSKACHRQICSGSDSDTTFDVLHEAFSLIK